ncbi:MAG: hypothetical protein A3I10_06500 [Deltaproteobacteria bacterium RIFCSPLOWO2_02_FULL_57_26]|nr:MAG: hypothetical protein A3I10_06500 [Deltaproteobacteria bacterium RIFCSPLOWO2_02_FULL_57_26]
MGVRLRLTRSLSLPFDLLRALGFTEGSNHHAATTEYHLPAGRSALEGLTTVFGMGPGVGLWGLGPTFLAVLKML